MNTFGKWAAVVVACALMAVSTVGCNTFRGAGKDIQKGGEGIENAAEGAQK